MVAHRLSKVRDADPDHGDSPWTNPGAGNPRGTDGHGGALLQTHPAVGAGMCGSGAGIGMANTIPVPGKTPQILPAGPLG